MLYQFAWERFQIKSFILIDECVFICAPASVPAADFYPELCVYINYLIRSSYKHVRKPASRSLIKINASFSCLISHQIPHTLVMVKQRRSCVLCSDVQIIHTRPQYLNRTHICWGCSTSTYTVWMLLWLYEYLYHIQTPKTEPATRHLNKHSKLLLVIWQRGLHKCSV